MPASTIGQPEWTTEDLQRFIIEPLEAASVIEAAGPNFLDSPQGVPVRIPSIETFDDPTWKAESEAIAEVEATSGERVLLPATLKSVKSIARLSNELVRHSPLALLSAFQQQQTRRTGKVLDQGFINGDAVPDGNGNHVPLGLLEQPGTQPATWISPPLTPDDVLDPISDAIGLLMAAEFEDLSRVRLIVPTAWFVAADKIKDNDDRPLLESDPTAPTRRRIKGIPVMVSSKMPADTGMLADMSQVYVARDLNPQVRILNERYADFDEVGIRVVTRADVGLAHAEGIVVLSETP
jgi:HK97 family phage major capsid protein